MSAPGVFKKTEHLGYSEELTQSTTDGYNYVNLRCQLDKVRVIEDDSIESLETTSDSVDDGGKKFKYPRKKYRIHRLLQLAIAKEGFDASPLHERVAIHGYLSPKQGKRVFEVPGLPVDCDVDHTNGKDDNSLLGTMSCAHAWNVHSHYIRKGNDDWLPGLCRRTKAYKEEDWPEHILNPPECAKNLWG